MTYLIKQFTPVVKLLKVVLKVLLEVTMGCRPYVFRSKGVFANFDKLDLQNYQIYQTMKHINVIPTQTKHRLLITQDKKIISIIIQQLLDFLNRCEVLE